MTLTRPITHHPDDGVLLAYATGTLGLAHRLVVGAHLETCPACRSRLAGFETVGGVMLEAQAPVALASDALARALAALDAPEPPPPAPRLTPASFPLGIELPKSLAGQDIGPWRWTAPGIEISKIEGLWKTRERCFLLRAAPGVTVPHHDHDGVELAQLLAGALVDEDQRFEVGDCAQAEPGLRHQPHSDPEHGCICLIAIDGRTRPSHWTGRLIQRFIDI
ncbi:ChrR family anti-sigma-E factor [Labrys okinawensis]|uniref:ChrR family anti-sigma-E factor n=1 Tax=Labrys okinawensis TaxID=346911 RepID=UPI0039BCD16C